MKNGDTGVHQETEKNRSVGFNRFLLFLILTFLLSSLWPIALLSAGSECPKDAWRWIINHLTYGLVHHFFFASAVGIFLSSLRLQVLRRAGKLAYGFLFALLVLVLATVFEDFAGTEEKPRQLQPYEIQKVTFGQTGLTTCQILQIEKVLREREEAERPLDQSEVELDQEVQAILTSWGERSIESFISLCSVRSLEEIREKGNSVAWIAGLLTWLFLCFCIVYVWYFVVTLYHSMMDDSTRLSLVVTLILLAFWAPSRGYVDWYQTVYLQTETFDSVTATLAGVFIVIIFSILAIRTLFKDRLKLELFMELVGVLIGVVSFLVAKFDRVRIMLKPFLEELSEKRSLLMLAIVVLLALIIGFARDLLVNRPSGGSRPKPHDASPDSEIHSRPLAPKSDVGVGLDPSSGAGGQGKAGEKK